MLTHLRIQNYALIDSLSIEFRSGFSVITGETGAGKSILLGAIGLLLGQRADSKSLKDSEKKCTVEAEFDLAEYGMESFFENNDLDFEGGECVIRREILSSGKSRAFVNDTPVQISVLKELGEQLVDVHSQHQNLLLNKENFQLEVLDILSDSTSLLEDYQDLFREYKSLKKQLKETIEQVEQSKADEEFLRFQLQQLEEAKLQSGELEELENESEVLSHAEDIKAALYQSDQVLNGSEGNGVLTSLRECSRSLQSISMVMPGVVELLNRTESCYIELKDIADELSNMSDGVEFNPSRLDFVNERLNTLYSLQKKHHVETVDELIDIATDLRNKLDVVDAGDEKIRELEEAVDVAYDKLLSKGKELTQLRRKASCDVERQITDYLILLGIPNVQFKVDLTERNEPEGDGLDKVNFLFSANKNGVLQPISQVASGGEIARVMLSLKALISGAVKLPTIIFDEIDTGVSGNIAEQMARIMQKMGVAKRQVISITHLPQIAALGSTHYKVYKEDDELSTTSHIIELTHEQRVEEIAHMLSGSVLTDAALNNAKELLKQSV